MPGRDAEAVQVLKTGWVSGKGSRGEPEFVLGPTDRAGAGGPQRQLVLVPPGKPALGTAAALPGQLLAEQQAAGVHIRGTVSEALPSLGAHGVGPQILGAAFKACSLFEDVCPGQEQRTPTQASPVPSPIPQSHSPTRARGPEELPGCAPGAGGPGLAARLQGGAQPLLHIAGLAPTGSLPTSPVPHPDSTCPHPGLPS